MKPEKKFYRVGIMVIILCLLVGFYFVNHWNLLPDEHYEAEEFGIQTVSSTVDFNNNGIDDYTDILIGARIDAENKPEYDGSYHAGGYPPEDMGVCTDVVWRAFKNAGYNLKAMMDEDIKNHTHLYPRVGEKPDPNIDFRRVPNLKVFFERFGVSLTLDPYEIEKWQPGDIVTFENRHIGIISDRRNKKGVPYIIHNGGQPRREENALAQYRLEISGHYRFDASNISESDVIPFD